MHIRALAIAVVLALAVAGVHGALYKWVDANGRVQYSDKPPEKDKGGVELSNRGVVVKKFEAGQTPEQKKAKDEEDARKKVEEAKAAEQRRHDTALLQSFTNVQEIDMKRDREIQALESAVANLRGQEKTVSERLLDDRKRAESYDKHKKPMPDSVKDDIVRGEAEQKVLADEVKRRLDEIVTTRSKYEVLKKRYQDLRQSSSPLNGPASAAAPSPVKK